MRIITVPAADRLGAPLLGKGANLAGIVPLISMMLNFESGQTVFSERLDRNPSKDVHPIISIPIGSGNTAAYSPSVGFVYCGAVAQIQEFAELVADLLNLASYDHLRGPRALASTPCSVTRDHGACSGRTAFLTGQCAHETSFSALKENTMAARLVTVSMHGYIYPPTSTRARFTWIFLPAKEAFDYAPQKCKVDYIGKIGNIGTDKFAANAAAIYFDNSGTFRGNPELYRDLAPTDFNVNISNDLNLDCVRNREGALLLTATHRAEFIGNHAAVSRQWIQADTTFMLPTSPPVYLKNIGAGCVTCGAPTRRPIVCVSTLDRSACWVVCRWCLMGLAPKEYTAYNAGSGAANYAAACAANPAYAALPRLGTATPIKDAAGAFFVVVAGQAPAVFAGSTLGKYPQITDPVVAMLEGSVVHSNLNLVWKTA